jgi:hypothetical protein
MLMSHRAPWLIDHGSTLYFHHSPGWEGDAARAHAPFTQISDHVLLGSAQAIDRQDDTMAAALTHDVIDEILSLVPDGWLAGGGSSPSPAEERAAYRRYFVERLMPPRRFVEEAVRGR